MSNDKPNTRSGPPKKKDEKEGMVLAPGGWRPMSTIHHVEPGHHISGKGGRLRKIHTASGQVVEDYGISPPDQPISRREDRPQSRRRPLARSPILTTAGLSMRSGTTPARPPFPISAPNGLSRLPPPPKTIKLSICLMASRQPTTPTFFSLSSNGAPQPATMVRLWEEIIGKSETGTFRIQAAEIRCFTATLSR
jgi:hypothetical protein